ncbi:MAG: methyl-accepting chemotaxis protein [Candidatus Heimdallarchaeota archaeon]|nr:methyl-accepting chemotaxis protein [Candidatus Heimdallarchaeota archaeon]
MAIFSIRNQMIVLVLIVFLGLTMQENVVSSSQVMLDQLNETGKQYREHDEKIIHALNHLEVQINTIVQTEFELIVIQLLLEDENIIGSQTHLLTEYNDTYTEIHELLKTREELNYEIIIEDPDAIQLFSIDEELLNSTAGVIEYVQYNILELFESMNTNLNTQVLALEDNAHAIRETYDTASNTIVETTLTLGNNNTGPFANVTKELDELEDNLATSGDDTYNFDMLRKFNDIGDALSYGMNAIIRLQTTGLGVDDADPRFLINRISEFNSQMNNVTKLYNAAYEAINATAGVRAEENKTLAAIDYTFTNQILPLFDDIGDAMDDLLDARSAMRILYSSTIDSLLTSFYDYYEIIVNQYLVEELREFEDLFEIVVAEFNIQVTTYLTWVRNIISVIVGFMTILIIINMLRTFSRVGKKFRDVSDGNLDIEIKQSYAKNEFGELEKGFDEVVRQLRSAISTFKTASDRLSGIAEELAAGSEEASASIREVSDTMREFSGGASEQNIMLSRITDHLAEHLQDVERSSARIGETSKFVLKVAKRTNILGLNAGIEAAKAGKYGRGFSVVADEVRDLSETTKGSANQIAEIIDDVQYSISKAVEDILREVNIVKEVAENTAAGSEQVSAATLEQVTILSEISETSSELAFLSQELNTLINRFSL